MIDQTPELSSDLEWMLVSRQVNETTLIGTLVNDYAASIYRLALQLLAEPVLSLQAVRETFISVVSHWHQYRSEYGVRPWIYSFAIQACHRIARHHLKGRQKLQGDSQSIDVPVYPDLPAENQAILALNQLRPASRLLVILQAIHGLPADEIARVMGWRGQQAAARLRAAGQSYLQFLSKGAGGEVSVDGVAAELNQFWPSLPFSVTDRTILADQISTQFNHRYNQRKFSLRAREYGLLGAFLALVAVFGWANNMIAPVPTPTVARTVISVVITTTPAANPMPEINLKPELSATAIAQARINAPPRPDTLSIVTLDYPLTDISTSFDLNSPGNRSGISCLAAALQYLGWDGQLTDIQEQLQPNLLDENVMAYELLNFVNDQTSYQAIQRFGGDISLLARLIGAGFPVIIERGLTEKDIGWYARYDLVQSYDKLQGLIGLLTPDSTTITTTMQAGVFQYGWLAFNAAYIITYPDDREGELFSILGRQANEQDNALNAAEAASEVIYTTRFELVRFYGWFNRGTSLTYLDDYTGAAAAYDEAFAIWETISATERPERMLWYQTRPYWAYYYSGRYQDVITLANRTLETMQDPVLEESYYWRALAKEALGDKKGAINDLKESLRINPQFIAGVSQLQRLTGGG